MYTYEQQQIIQSYGDVKTVAVAGSGKTTTQFGYAEYHDNKEGLYLVYNKSNRTEALARAKNKGYKNLTIHTAHSLAWKPVGRRYKKLIMSDVPLQLIINKCQIRDGEMEKRFTIAQMIKDGIATYCNKSGSQLSPADFAQQYSRDIINQYYGPVTEAITYMIEEMYYGRFPITYDFYLKIFAEQKTILYSNRSKRPYDFILFDEAQDANGVMLDIIMRQEKAAKIIVGDPAQQIYTWRGAINALDKVPFTQKNLTNSFRFGPEIAAKANDILRLKSKIGTYANCVQIKGMGNSEPILGKTGCLSRTVTGLFKMMVDNYLKNPAANNYIEGGLHANKWLYGGGLLNDVYYLWAKKPNKIKDPVVKQCKHIDELRAFARNTNNRDIMQLIDLVFGYKSEIFSLKTAIIQTLVKDKAEADFCFSTVHKAKGQEYDYVIMDQTFVTNDDINGLHDAIMLHQQKHGPGLSSDLWYEVQRMNEEINIKYVACTRARVEVKDGF